MIRRFTGKRMAALLVAGFGVVIAVNLLMATLAVGGFSGVVVDNSYVASQRFNGWLREARHQQALGWTALPKRLSNGRVAIEAIGVPTGAAVSAMLRRPIGERETTLLSFSPDRTGRFLSHEAIGSGRWIVRLTIAADGKRWAWEGPLT